MIAPDSVPVD